MNFYYFSLCHYCKKASPDLKKCSSCKVLYYCSRDHQKRDWGHHKELCKVIAKTNRILIYEPGCSAENFNHYKSSAGLLWGAGLNRKPKQFEHQMWMFPKVCAVCYSSDVTIICENCLSVAYCSEEHYENNKGIHTKHCTELKICLSIHQAIHCKQVNSRLIDLKKWNFNMEIQNLPENTQKVMDLLGLNMGEDFSKEHANFIVTTDLLVPAINIIYALEKSGYVQNRNGNKGEIVIHVVGADAAEDALDWALIHEFLLHWVTNLTTLSVYFIGPNAIPYGMSEINKNHTLCSDCKKKPLHTLFLKMDAMYHDVIGTLSKPTVVLAFNSGLHEFSSSETSDTWKKTIPCLTHYKGVPLLLTAYTEDEIKKDVARFDMTHLKYLVEPQRNPYSDLRPNRNWEEGSDPIYYQNGFVAVLTKK